MNPGTIFSNCATSVIPWRESWSPVAAVMESGTSDKRSERFCAVTIISPIASGGAVGALDIVVCCALDADEAQIATIEFAMKTHVRFFGFTLALPVSCPFLFVSGEFRHLLIVIAN